MLLLYASPPVQKLHHCDNIISNYTSPSFSQHALRQCYNYLGILSSTAEILLFNSVFHDEVTSVSVSTLKPLLGVIGAIPLKLQASPIVMECLNTNNFIFLFFYFSDFILILFYLLFYFSFGQ